MPSEFFRVSTTWVVDFSYEGRARRVFKIFGSGIDVSALMTTLGGGMLATSSQYLRGDEPKNAFCPTARGAGLTGDKPSK